MLLQQRLPAQRGVELRFSHDRLVRLFTAALDLEGLLGELRPPGA